MSMRRDRCFKNLIGKASVFFASFFMAAVLAGCEGDAVSEFFKNNNLMNSDDTFGFAKDKKENDDSDKADEENTEGFEQSNDTITAADIEANAGFNQETSDAGDFEGDSSNSGESDSENDNSGNAATENSDSVAFNADGSDSGNSRLGASDAEGDDSSHSGTFDPDKVNKAIDDLISEIERETGRTGRRRDVEENDGGQGDDSTTYFSDTFQQAQKEALGLSIVDIEGLKRSQQGKYAFEHLTDEGKTLYVEIMRIIEKRAEDIVVSTLDEEVLDVVCQFVLADHPEFFYMDGYTYTRYTVAGVLKKISFTGNYIYGPEEIAARQQKIDAYVNTCLAGAPLYDDDYAKVKYVYDYLISNTEYDAEAPDNQNICSVFLYGKSVCQGYAKATQYLLNKIGVPTTMVTGKVNGVGHAWNLVYADGEYTYVDTTWGDSSYQKYESGGVESQKLPLINYTYLCCTTQDISRTHTIAETLPMPDCTSMRNNYYVREGEYFTENDMNALGSLFSRRYADGSNNVTIKCSTRAVYDEFIKRLITDQEVFGYIEGSNNTVSYTTFDEQYILIIWLY